MVRSREAMSTRQPRVPNQLGRAAVQMFAASERMNQILIEHLDPTAWKAKPPGKARTIAAIFTHMHNARCKWIRLTAPHLKVPRQLERTHCTPRQARAGLTESAARCGEMLAEALGGAESRIEKFHRDGWARAWPVARAAGEVGVRPEVIHASGGDLLEGDRGGAEGERALGVQGAPASGVSTGQAPRLA